MKKITWDDLVEAMKQAELNKTIFLEDDLQIIEVCPLGYPKKITLKPKGLKILKGFCNVGEVELKETGAIDFMGIKIVTCEVKTKLIDKNCRIKPISLNCSKKELKRFKKGYNKAVTKGVCVIPIEYDPKIIDAVRGIRYVSPELTFFEKIKTFLGLMKKLRPIKIGPAKLTDYLPRVKMPRAIWKIGDVA